VQRGSSGLGCLLHPWTAAGTLMERT